MERSILPVERAIRLQFVGSECLYRDHHGRRVILDVEGSGRYTIPGRHPVEIEVDGVPTQAREGTFQRSVLAAMRKDGAAMAYAYVGPTLVLPTSGAVEFVGVYHGAGWVLDSKATVLVDDLPDGEGVNPAYPTPFFESIQCGAETVVLPDPTTRCDLIDTFSIAEEDGLKARGWKVQNISAITRLSSFDGAGQPLERSVASHLNRASWTAKIPPGNRGLIIRKLYDRFHGRQHARVLIDGEMAGWWYEPGQDRERRWGYSRIGVPAEFTRGKGQVEIAIDPPGGAPLWSIARYDLFALLTSHP